MVETIAAADSSRSESGANGTHGEDTATQDQAGEPYPPEFYAPYLSSLSQTWLKSPSERSCYYP